MAELLIRAKEHWMDTFTQEQLDTMTEEERKSYKARSQKGDIIVVRPDNWAWGREECLPHFIVVKVHGDSADFKYLEESISERFIDDTGRLQNSIVRHRKNYIDVVDVDAVKEEVRDFEEITPVQLNAEIKIKAVNPA
jgi:hypothetical protein